MGDLYGWLKIGHLFSLIAWMAAMFYLPRLFVYHADLPVGSAQADTFKVMERRLLKAIMTPAMIATWVFGLWLAVEGGWFSAGWLHGKLALVLLLSGFHGACSAWTRAFAQDRNTKPARFFRIANEVPTVLLLVILVLVVLKPF
jgi:protoporphyrinogen IX oxidase